MTYIQVQLFFADSENGPVQNSLRRISKY